MGLIPSKHVPDSEYLLERSTTEARLAANAETEQAAAAHRRIASCYLAKLFSDDGAASSDDERATRPLEAAECIASGPSVFRFADLSAVPENDELTRLLHCIP